MKKKVFSFLGLVAIVGVVVFNVSMNLSNSAQNDLLLANIEALARGEGGDGYGDIVCYYGDQEHWYPDGSSPCSSNGEICCYWARNWNHMCGSCAK